MVVLEMAAALMLLSASSAGKLKSDKRILNICMDGKHHTPEPTSTLLYGLCKGWESNSCCSNTTAFHAQQSFSLLYNYNLSHCGPMSDKCLKRFYLSNCFYECSPNVGPWLRPDKSSVRNERFFDVPICASDCEAWWDDCKNDLTCTNNLAGGFDWKTGTNRCPANSKCQKFHEWFPNATFFCENVYPHDYKVQNDSKSCIRLDFQGLENPNAKVAEACAKRNGLCHPEHDGKTAVTQSDDKVIPADSAPCQSGATVPMAILILLLAAIVIGLLLCKCRDMMETSRRAGTSYFSGIRWLRNMGTTNHRDLDDDRQFLRDSEDGDDSVVNPHGTLEINL